MNRRLAASLALSAGVIGVSLGRNVLVEQGLVDADLSARFLGLAMGILMVLIGNAIPKEAAACSRVETYRLRRFGGLLFMAGGALFALSWALLPMAQAPGFAVAALGGAVVIITARLLWAARKMAV